MKLFMFILIGLIIIVGLFIVFTFFIYASKTGSPDKKYMASYSRFSKVMTVEEINTHIKSNFGNCESPVFSWSPNSKFLAMTVTDSVDGNRFSQILDLEHHYVCLVPDQSTIQTYIQKQNRETQVLVKNKISSKMETTKWRVEIKKWLDNDTVLVEFSCPSDKSQKAISGSFIFEVSTYSMKQFTITG